MNKPFLGLAVIVAASASCFSPGFIGTPLTCTADVECALGDVCAARTGRCV